MVVALVPRAVNISDNNILDKNYLALVQFNAILMARYVFIALINKPET
jgi:hypothetical protein